MPDERRLIDDDEELYAGYPAFIKKPWELQGLTDLRAINTAGNRSEFSSNDERYKIKKTFAVQIGYVGTLYSGFEQQKNKKNEKTQKNLKKSENLERSETPETLEKSETSEKVKTEK